MNSLLRGFVGDSFSTSVRPLSVAIIYEDSDTHRQAMTVWEFLVRQLGESADLTATWWRTSLLSDPKLSHSAARAVAGSDLILVAVHARPAFPATLKEWINSWPAPNNPAGAVVALLHEQSSTECDRCLRDWARRKNLVYLEGTASTLTEPTTPNLNPVGFAPWQFENRIEPYLHGGLNE